MHLLDDADPEVEAQFDALLPRRSRWSGSRSLPAERLERAGQLRATGQRRGQLLPQRRLRRPASPAACTCSAAARRTRSPWRSTHSAWPWISPAGSAGRTGPFARGQERYVSASTQDSILLTGADVGLVGYGNLGRALHRLLAPFRCTIRVFDPWLPERALTETGAIPADLERVVVEQHLPLRARHRDGRECAPAG